MLRGSTRAVTMSMPCPHLSGWPLLRGFCMIRRLNTPNKKNNINTVITWSSWAPNVRHIPHLTCACLVLRRRDANPLALPALTLARPVHTHWICWIHLDMNFRQLVMRDVSGTPIMAKSFAEAAPPEQHPSELLRRRRKRWQRRLP